MKFLQKATLAAAVAAAPFAAQSMEALDDATLAATTGQAGVTIEINIDSQGITIGEVEYTDTGSGATGGGSVALQNISVKDVTNLTQEIDVDENGNLLIGMSGVEGMKVAIGDTVADTSGKYSALALRSASGETTEVVNNIDMTLNIGESTTTIMNLAAAGNATAKGQLPASAQSGSVAIVSETAIQITDMNVGAFGYTDAQSAGAATSGAAAYNAKYSTLTGAEQTAFAQANSFDADNNGVVEGAELTSYESALANNSAVQIEGLQFYKVDDKGTADTSDDTVGAATISQTIWAKGGPAALGGGVYIQVGEISGTVDIAGIKMGGESIGQVKISDLNLAGLTQRIYGH